MKKISVKTFQITPHQTPMFPNPNLTPTTKKPTTVKFAINAVKNRAFNANIKKRQRRMR
jgi:hypothetical protein